MVKRGVCQVCLPCILHNLGFAFVLSGWIRVLFVQRVNNVNFSDVLSFLCC